METNLIFATYGFINYLPITTCVLLIFDHLAELFISQRGRLSESLKSGDKYAQHVMTNLGEYKGKTYDVLPLDNTGERFQVAEYVNDYYNTERSLRVYAAKFNLVPGWFSEWLEASETPRLFPPTRLDCAPSSSAVPCIRQSRIEVQDEVAKVPAAEIPEIRWTPPAPTTLKCNTDGSWSKETGVGGVGWLLRDHQGTLLWAGAKKMAVMRSAIETEAEAIRWTIQTLVGFGYSRVSFETDSLVLAKMLNGEEEFWPVLEPILQDISTSLSSNGGFEVVYYPRSGNKSADRIAKETTTFTSFVPKLYSMVPLWLKLCLETDKPVV
ncbi:BnaC06g24790D [Brassica napus]|uniref:BnaC06g24790D protein n=1 Tax=Brassica napus TaxID=3708 RepID=A0A078GAQ3_BRANA|nr:BnaC06g24790D [Brassica napus]